MTPVDREVRRLVSVQRQRALGEARAADGVKWASCVRLHLLDASSQKSRVQRPPLQAAGWRGHHPSGLRKRPEGFSLAGSSPTEAPHLRVSHFSPTESVESFAARGPAPAASRRGYRGQKVLGIRAFIGRPSVVNLLVPGVPRLMRPKASRTPTSVW